MHSLTLRKLQVYIFRVFVFCSPIFIYLISLYPISFFGVKLYLLWFFHFQVFEYSTLVNLISHFILHFIPFHDNNYYVLYFYFSKINLLPLTPVLDPSQASLIRSLHYLTSKDSFVQQWNVLIFLIYYSNFSIWLSQRYFWVFLSHKKMSGFRQCPSWVVA